MLGTVLIVGGGTAGWMSAAALAHHLRGLPVKVRLVESEAIGTVGVGEATVPHIREFNQLLDIPEEQFLAETKATFKLGIEFVNWARKGDSYIHPFDAFGDGGFPDFHHLFAADKEAESLDPYSLAVTMAREGKFIRPGDKGYAPDSPFNYAYQFDASQYAAFLRRFAEARGVERTEGRIAEVEKAEDGLIAAVKLEDGTRIEADFFIDCSGFRSLLVGDALGSEFESWEHWLPCDRAIAIPCALDGDPPPFTQAVAQDAGWIWHIPLQHRMGNGHVYSSQFIEDDQAEAELRASLEGEALADANKLRFKAGKRPKQWVGNAVAVGLSSGFLEPLESTSIHLIQVAIEQIVERLPHGKPDQRDIDDFNRVMNRKYDYIRDFIILHYCATERDDTPFWNHVRTMELPDSLQSKMEAFAQRGIVPLYTHDIFLEPSWLAVFYGQRVKPSHPHPLASARTIQDIRKTMGEVTGKFGKLSASAPMHHDYVGELVARGGQG